MFVRRFFGLIIGVGIFVSFSQAFALDNVEREIVKCRANADSVAQQVTCLEEALRRMVENTGEPDWASAVAPPPDVDTAIGTTPPPFSNSTTRGIGAEQIPSNREISRAAQSKIKEQSVVADFAYNQSDRLILVLSNGQVWKQRTGDLNYVRLKRGDRPAVIVRPGTLSGYRMEFPELGQTIIVSRIQ